MSFSYTGTGGMVFFGCADVSYERFYPYNFAVGSIVYELARARTGRLEKLCIKTVLIHNRNSPTFPEFTYLDTLNHVWLQKELCSESDGINAALNYYTRLQEEIIEELENII